MKHLFDVVIAAIAVLFILMGYLAGMTHGDGE